jgi:RNA 2',3'-cyclic 3'-phosphodiesterase
MSNPETWRLFVAIQLPDPVKAELGCAQAELGRALPDAAVRWTRPGQLHLTLKFLGDVDARRVEALIEALRPGCGAAPALHLRARCIGAFPNLKSARVIWAGVEDAPGHLERLQASVESAVREFTSEKPEGKFTGHVTLGRVKHLLRPQAETLAAHATAMANRVFGEWRADQVGLIWSQLASSGPTYTTLAALPLAGAGDPPPSPIP